MTRSTSIGARIGARLERGGPALLLLGRTSRGRGSRPTAAWTSRVDLVARGIRLEVLEVGRVGLRRDDLRGRIEGPQESNGDPRVRPEVNDRPRLQIGRDAIVAVKEDLPRHEDVDVGPGGEADAAAVGRGREGDRPPPRPHRPRAQSRAVAAASRAPSRRLGSWREESRGDGGEEREPHGEPRSEGPRRAGSR